MDLVDTCEQQGCRLLHLAGGGAASWQTGRRAGQSAAAAPPPAARRSLAWSSGSSSAKQQQGHPVIPAARCLCPLAAKSPPPRRRRKKNHSAHAYKSLTALSASLLRTGGISHVHMASIAPATSGGAHAWQPASDSYNNSKTPLDLGIHAGTKAGRPQALSSGLA